MVGELVAPYGRDFGSPEIIPSSQLISLLRGAGGGPPFFFFAKLGCEIVIAMGPLGLPNEPTFF